MDFNVTVNANVQGLTDVESLEKKIDALSKTKHKISLDVDLGGKDIESLLKGFSNGANGTGFATAGKEAGIQFSKGFSTAKFTPNIIDYGNMKKAAKLEVKKISTDMKKELSDVTTKDTNKWANQYVSDRNKAYKQSVKEQEDYLKGIQNVVNQQKKIEVQQQIAAMKQNAVSKNAHYNDLVNQGKANIEKWTKKYTKSSNESALLRKKFENGEFSSTSSKMKSALSQYERQDFEALNKARSYFKEYTSIADDLSKHFEESNPFTLDSKQIEEYSQKLPSLKKQFTNVMTEVRSESSKTASELSKITKSNEVMSYYNSNTKMQKKYGQSILNIAESYKNATTEGDIQTITTQYKELKSAISSEGLEGKSLFDEISRGFKDIAQFTMTYGILQKIPDIISQSVTELKDLDSILTEISKTSDSTNAELKQLGNDSFESASKYGQKASSYLTGVQEMNRSGYYGEQGIAMAELSVLAQAAGDMSADMSNSYLLATNAAYQYQGSVEKLNAALDGQNMISNRNSVSMADMAQATSEAASMAAQTGVEIDQLSAIIGTIESRTKSGGSEVGNAIKAILINLQNTASDKIVDTLDAAGASMTEYIDGIERLRNPIDILKDLAETYNSLDDADPLKAEILTNIGQKYHANKLSALLTGWSDYEKMLTDYSQGMGSAAIEAEKSASNWEGSLNRLSNTFTDLIANFADADKITSGINFVNTMVSGIDTLSESIGNIGTIGGALGVFTDLKGVG